jgi:multiple sugar transport system substrate-binding protein
MEYPLPIQLKGLTWAHPRATSPLEAAKEPLRQLRPDITISWEVQPLSGFEGRPIVEAARNYDLIVFDHPHVGEVAESELFEPVGSFLQTIGVGDADFIGPALASYRYGEHVWGFPLDAACQVSCWRPDLLAGLGGTMPQDWAVVLELGEQALRKNLRLAIAFSGVHSLMTLLTLCANQGAPLSSSSTAAFADRDAARNALGAMRDLLRFCPPQALDWDSIAAQEAMSTRDDLVYCPAVYGFAPYSRVGRPRALVYGDLPGLRAGFAGSTLGGAGLGISAYTNHPDAAFAVAGFLIDARVQEEIIALNDGQPARLNAWESARVNTRSGGFYSLTKRTLEQAWIRPRWSGYLHFQRAGGPLVESFLRGHASMEDTLDRLEQAWAAALPEAH